MANILLVEPDYRSKFPPLGLMRIASYHKQVGDSVTFVAGKIPQVRDVKWHRIYISSLFTYELPRTIRTIKYYAQSVPNPDSLIVGGIGASLMPGYISDRVNCHVIQGALDRPNMLGPGTPRIDKFLPDYSLIDSSEKMYLPEDSYFCRVTVGCIRKCAFCAVSKLEPKFGYLNGIKTQLKHVRESFGERQNLVLMDNNILASDRIEKVVSEIKDEGFQSGAKRNNKKRTVDINQGIDARLINKKIARLLGSLSLSPVRLAFDYDGVREAYINAVTLLCNAGLKQFTTYLMFNFNDTPMSFYERMRLNPELSMQYDIRVSGFPMKYVPIHDVDRKHISKNWQWRYFRGIQCVLLATHGLVSPSLEFFEAAFGKNYDEFIEIISMPDRYIIHREDHKKNKAAAWKKLFRKLSAAKKAEFIQALEVVHRSRETKKAIAKYPEFWNLLEHYYPDSSIPHD